MLIFLIFHPLHWSEDHDFLPDLKNEKGALMTA